MWNLFFQPVTVHSIMSPHDCDVLWITISCGCRYVNIAVTHVPSRVQERKCGAILLWGGGWWPSFERLKKEDRKDVQGFRAPTKYNRPMEAPPKYNRLGISRLIKQKRSQSQQWPASLTTNRYWHFFPAEEISTPPNSKTHNQPLLSGEMVASGDETVPSTGTNVLELALTEYKLN